MIYVAGCAPKIMERRLKEPIYNQNLKCEKIIELYDKKIALKKLIKVANKIFKFANKINK